MTDKNGSNDIAEMLRLLRESVDNDRAKSDNDDVAEEEPEEITDTEEIPEEDDSDPWYDEEEEEEVSEEEDAEIKIASEEEREDEEDDEVDPWFSAPKEEPAAEIAEEDEDEEEIEESSFAYSDEEEVSDEPVSEEENEEYVEETIEETIEETAEEDEPSEEEEIDVFTYPEEDAPDEEEEIDVFAYPEEDAPAEEEEIDVFVSLEEDEEPIEEVLDIVEEPEAEEAEEIEDEIFSDIADDENIDRELEEIQEIEEDNDGDEILDETDISLLQNMGYTSFAMNDTSVDHEEVKGPDNSSKGDIAYDHNGEEHVVRKQADKIKIDYADQKKKTIIRLVVAGVAALLLLVYEYLAFAEIELPGLLNQHDFPVSHAMISLQLLVIAAIMSFDLVIKGIYDAFRFGCTPYSVASVLILVNAVYTVIVAIFRPEDYMLFNFGGALAAVLAILYEYLMLVSEEKAFYAVSFSGAKKYAFAEDSDCKHFGNQPTLRAYNTDFNKNFFARMGKRISSYNYLGILIPVSVVLGALLCAVLWTVNGDVTSAISAGMLVVNFALPLGVMGAYSVPMLLSMLSLKKEKGAIIGHSATECYDKTRFVTFDETDLFPSMKTTYIDLKPCGDQPIADVLIKTSMLFSAIGGIR